MWNYELLGTDIYHIVHWFFVYSIIGWILESTYMSFCNKKLTNRGFIKGPICPIYGVGALSVYFLLRPFEGNYLVLYALGSILATSLEYVTALIMIQVFGSVWWDYSEKPFNYKGILCLESSIAWGFYTVFMFGFLQKFVVAVVNGYSYQIGLPLGKIVIAYFLLDFSYCLLKAKWDSVPKSVGELQQALRSAIGRE